MLELLEGCELRYIVFNNEGEGSSPEYGSDYGPVRRFILMFMKLADEEVTIYCIGYKFLLVDNCIPTSFSTNCNFTH